MTNRPTSSATALRGVLWTTASLVAVTLIKLAAFDEIGPATPFLLYFASIMVAAGFGGWIGGLVATAVSALVGSYFFMEPFGVIAVVDLPSWIRLGVFVAEGVAITGIMAAIRRERARAVTSEQWFSTTLRSIGDAVIATDARGRVTFLNVIAAQLTGWSQADAAGRPLAEIFRVLDEDTRQPIESPVDRVLRERKVVGLANHSVLIARDGAEAAIDDSAAPITDEDGVLVGTVLVFRDVSQRRGDELRRAFVARAMGALAASLDYKKTLGTVARLAVPTIGDWCAIDMVDDGRLMRLAVAHVDPDKVRLVYELQDRYPADPESETGVHEILRTGKPMYIARIPQEMLAAAARDDEHRRLIESLELRSYIGVPLTVEGKTVGVLSLATAESGRELGELDLALAITLADRASQAIHHATLFAAAERANRAKDEFLALLGHELRNPLAPILTALQLMALRAPSAFERERQILERQVKHLVTLVDDLLDVSRITRGKIELAREPVCMPDPLGKALELAAPVIEARRHEVVVDVPRDLCVIGDSVRLAQVFSNLLTNAAKYTDPGGRIEVRGTRQGDEISVSVRDNGVGIAPELTPRIFDLFVQGGQSLDRASGGLGLGLAIVKSVVELHGGRVSVASGGLGKGSEFRVVLPAAEPAAAAPSPPEPRAPVTAGHRVLVVDDNEDALELMAEALRLGGHEVHTAGDPAAAIALAPRVQPDIALLDIGLPVMDGYELARRLRATDGGSGLKLVAVTGYGQASDREKTKAAGFDAHLVKPVSLDAVQQVIERLLAK